MLHVPDAEALLSFPRSKWGIPEPTDEQAAAMEDGLLTAAIDTVIVPAVAFDSSCRRLGQGRGYYDTFLQKLAAAREAHGLPPVTTIGIGLQEQLVESVPVDAHDVPLDFVFLPEVLLSRAAASAPPSPPSPPAGDSVATDGRSLRPRRAKSTEVEAPPPHPVHGVDTGLLPED